MYIVTNIITFWKWLLPWKRNNIYIDCSINEEILYIWRTVEGKRILQNISMDVIAWFTTCNGCCKEKVEFWEQVKKYYVSVIIVIMQVEEHLRKNVPWKAWLFKCFHILNMACNDIKIRSDFYGTYLCSPIYIFLCTVLVTLPRLGQVSYHFDDSRTLQYTCINIFWSIPHRFFHKTIAWPELDFIFNLQQIYKLTTCTNYSLHIYHLCNWK